ncbi:polysaccharide pyruvyl transferase family protein [Rhodococcus sp. IEGM 1354]|uniref:polysaccharide pyruvyl transferase family protein n=1 Tax=Rhodococcus sp. IEGM 1354 TaxID=3047088 RepID=UPI0024B7A95F|nr:polysaccharide pyruvyl transferase family protein [Rhodococcus sp. IEGM 1354]MDI9929501.1 polysaccharide pyruvyl transferase family protein [Rhodococcus sp. IEGM 1354]
MNLVSVGAFDRFNYGDLLFPLVLDAAWNEVSNSPMRHFALHGASGRAWGTLPSESARALREYFEAESGVSGCIVAGGDVLGASWFDLAWHSLPSVLDMPAAALSRLVPRSKLSSSVRRIAGGKWRLPFVPDAVTARRVPIVYNAVGATSMSGMSEIDRSYVVDALKSASYVSVRDKTGNDLLREMGVHSVLVPDSASVIKKLMPGFPKKPGSVVFQCSRHWLRSQYEDDVFGSIRVLADSFDHVYLLAIGLAGGHSDMTSLRKIKRALDVDNVSLISPNNVFEVARPIAGADCYVGSSLHGAITALAYGTPVVGLNRVPKLTAYLQTWAADVSYSDVAPSVIADSVLSSRNRDPADLAELGDRLSELSSAATRSMLDIFIGSA